MNEAGSIEQAVILCGGIGSRLGALTRAVPKPLLPIAARPFLERLLFEIKRHGLHRVLLLAAHMASEVEHFAAETSRRLNIEIEVAIEPERAGTGGALWHARARLDPQFFLFNGDSWFDFNLLDLVLLARHVSPAIVAMALRAIDDAARYGAVDLADDERVTRFGEYDGRSGPSLVNGGVYVVDRALIDYLRSDCSLEQDVLQPLAKKGLIAGRIYDGFFIDIGIPSDYERAQSEVPARQRRKAVFLDRDGVLNEDHGYVGTIERFDWLPGAMQAIKALNDHGFLVFVVTNQAGVAKGRFGEDDVRRLHEHMRRQLALIGAHIDDFRYCPFHPEGTELGYAQISDWRKPAPGMLLDLIATWPVDSANSIMIGDRNSDVLAGENAGLKACLINKGETLGEVLARFYPVLRSKPFAHLAVSDMRSCS